MRRDDWQDLDQLKFYFQHFGAPFDWMVRRKWFANSGGERIGEGLEVHIATTAADLTAAEELVAVRYAWRGYQTSAQDGGNPTSAAEAPACFTFLASRDNNTVGTISVGVDATAGLLLDEGNHEAVDALRRAGRRVTEFIKLAVLDDVDAKEVLYHLFRSAYTYVRMLYQATDILIEVNPRHATFYQKVLGFAIAGVERVCARVNAPAILMRSDLLDLDQRSAGRFAARIAEVERDTERSARRAVNQTSLQWLEGMAEFAMDAIAIAEWSKEPKRPPRGGIKGERGTQVLQRIPSCAHSDHPIIAV